MVAYCIFYKGAEKVCFLPSLETQFKLYDNFSDRANVYTFLKAGFY